MRDVPWLVVSAVLPPQQAGAKGRAPDLHLGDVSFAATVESVQDKIDFLTARTIIPRINR